MKKELFIFAEAFTRALLKYTKTESSSFPIVLMIFIMTVYAYVSTSGLPSDPPISLEESNTYQQKIAELNNISSNLEELQTFIANQKTQLEETEIALQKLEQEQKQLQPVVEANREVVDTLLNSYIEAHERQSQQNIWRERILGFFSGVLSSLVATQILGFWRWWKVNRPQMLSE